MSAEFLYQRMGCPNCGAPLTKSARECEFCGSVLMLTRVVDAVSKRLETGKVTAVIGFGGSILRTFGPRCTRSRSHLAARPQGGDHTVSSMRAMRQLR